LAILGRILQQHCPIGCEDEMFQKERLSVYKDQSRKTENISEAELWKMSLAVLAEVIPRKLKLLQGVSFLLYV
jgi:hypothetical protein